MIVRSAFIHLPAGAATPVTPIGLNTRLNLKPHWYLFDHPEDRLNATKRKPCQNIANHVSRRIRCGVKSFVEKRQSVKWLIFDGDGQESKHVVMPDEYFLDTVRPQLWSLFEEDALKDTTINLRASSITTSSFILSLLSPVLRKMVCGNFRERLCKEISLEDVEAERLLQLLRLACGNKDVVANDIGGLVEIGELAERLQMEAVKSEIEYKLWKELKVENCLEMFERSEASGLELLEKECYNMIRDELDVISQKGGFLRLSEEAMGALLEEEELGVRREEDLFEAVLRWISMSDEEIRGVGLLGKIRYGVMSNEYLAAQMETVLLPAHGVVKELVGETMAKKGVVGGEEMWDGVERLCDKWMVARGMKGRVIGADVLQNPRYIAMDGQGRIVISDTGLHEIIIFNHDGSLARRFGLRGAAAGKFDQPRGVAMDGQGHIIVADCGNHRIQMLNADGSVARCFGTKGTAVGRLNAPYGVAIDRKGHIVVADFDNNRIQVFDPDGSVVRRFGSRGAAVGQLDRPTGVAVDGVGRIVVAEWGNHRVQVFNGDGSVALCFGSKGDGPGQLMYPLDVAVDGAGKFVVADSSNHRIQVFNSDGSVARVIGSAGYGVGELRYPYGVAIDGTGRIVVAEGGYNHRVQVL